MPLIKQLEKNMSGLSFTLSPELERTLESLQKQTNSNSKDEVLLRAVALLKLVLEASNGEETIVISDKNNKPKMEILL